MKEKLKKIIRSRFFTLFIILVFITACIGVGALIAFIQHESDPTDEAVRYFRAFVQRDYDRMYDLLYIDDGYYVDKDMYKSVMKKIRDNIKIDSYDVGKPEKKDGIRTVKITCMNDQTGESKEFVVYITGKRDGFQLMPDYHINIDYMLVENFSVVVPKGDHLELNGKKIDEKRYKVDADDKGNRTFSLKGF